MLARRRPPESPRPPRFPGSPGAPPSINRANANSFRKNLSGSRCWHALCLCRRQPPQALPRFQVRGPPLPASIQQEPCQPLPLPQFYIIFTVGFLPKEKPPRAQTPRGFRSSMTRVLPGKVFSQRTPRALRLFPRRTPLGSSLGGSDLNIL